MLCARVCHDGVGKPPRIKDQTKRARRAKTLINEKPFAKKHIMQFPVKTLTVNTRLQQSKV